MPERVRGVEVVQIDLGGEVITKDRRVAQTLYRRVKVARITVE